MAEFILEAELRKSTGKHAKYVLANGKIPGVYYAHGDENINLEVPRLKFEPLVYTSETFIVDLRVKDGEAKKCILRDVQFDPISDKAIHFDLQGLRENEKLHLEIPIVLHGVPKGVRDGGMLQHIIHKLKIACLPKDIPGKVDLDVSSLEINDSIHVRDLSIPNVEILDNAESAVLAVIPPTVVKEVAPVEAVVEETKEPEVVGKGKKEDEE